MTHTLATSTLATPLTLLLFLLFMPSQDARGQAVRKRANVPVSKSKAGYGAASSRRDRDIAALFAPVFYQRLGDHPRADLITNFDFDGDWRGDNNWTNTDDQRFALRAYIYYAVSETPTHIFIHYALFHPRDYKGGGMGGPLLSGAIREGVRRGGRYDPTGLSSGAVLAHENDLEGCLVVASKSGDDPARARVVYVETLGHDHFQKYLTEDKVAANFKQVRTEGQRPLLYVEPKGHGVSAYDGTERESREVKDAKEPKDVKESKESKDLKESNETKAHKMLVYRFAGKAGDAMLADVREVGYELLPLYSTLWPRARGGANQTYGRADEFGPLTVGVAGAAGKASSTRRVVLGKLGAAFRGKVGAENAARPPWGWFDRDERDAGAGSWFFDPAATVKRHLNPVEEFSTSYLHAPFLGIFRR
jgi:hypothetical protein